MSTRPGEAPAEGPVCSPQGRSSAPEEAVLLGRGLHSLACSPRGPAGQTRPGPDGPGEKVLCWTPLSGPLSMWGLPAGLPELLAPRGFHAGVRVVGRRSRELWEGLTTMWPEAHPVWGPLLPGAPLLGAQRAGLK